MNALPQDLQELLYPTLNQSAWDAVYPYEAREVLSDSVRLFVTEDGEVLEVIDADN